LVFSSIRQTRKIASNKPRLTRQIFPRVNGGFTRGQLPSNAKWVEAKPFEGRPGPVSRRPFPGPFSRHRSNRASLGPGTA